MIFSDGLKHSFINILIVVNGSVVVELSRLYINIYTSCIIWISFLKRFCVQYLVEKALCTVLFFQERLKTSITSKLLVLKRNKKLQPASSPCAAATNWLL